MSSSMHRKRPVALIACSSKRRARTAAASDAATSTNASSLASLPKDLIGLIGQRVLAGDLLDYIRFRAVCPHWRRSTTCPRGRGIVDPRFHPRRWMMLPEGHGLHPGHTKLRGYIRFFNLSSGAFIRVRLPLFRDHCVLDSVDGILLLQRDHDTAVRLLNPLTGDIAEFPPLVTLRPYANRLGMLNWWHARSIRAASISVSADEVVTVMMLLPITTHAAFAISGDQRWRVSSWSITENELFRPLAFQGKLYFFRQSSPYRGPEVLEINPPLPEETDLFLPPPKLIAKCPGSGYPFLYKLVECNSEILVVIKDYAMDTKFLVYRLADLILESIVPLTSIGGNSLFIGWNSMCVSSKAFPAVVSDTIVFTHNQKGYLLQYDLSSVTVSPAEDVHIGRVLGPLNIFYHIFTCCYRQEWNKGRIVFQGKPGVDWWGKRKWRQGA